jgi:hypothetical protein
VTGGHDATLSCPLNPGKPESARYLRWAASVSGGFPEISECGSVPLGHPGLLQRGIEPFLGLAEEWADIDVAHAQCGDGDVGIDPPQTRQRRALLLGLAAQLQQAGKGESRPGTGREVLTQVVSIEPNRAATHLMAGDLR